MTEKIVVAMFQIVVLLIGASIAWAVGNGICEYMRTIGKK